MIKQWHQLSYEELLSLDREGIKEAYAGHRIDVEDTFKYFQEVKKLRIEKGWM